MRAASGVVSRNATCNCLGVATSSEKGFAVARSLRSAGVRVNNVAPGLIQTDITAGKLTDAMRAKIIEGIPLGRLGTAEDVARIYLFLASDLSAYVTGAVIDVNGGMLIHG